MVYLFLGYGIQAGRLESMDMALRWHGDRGVGIFCECECSIASILDKSEVTCAH